ncbi:MAG TPA: J domain-containing protein [Methylomirabilota bacterium]|nr:J domain-containing protein [Methylomirabilota bacterium]
MPVEYKDYYKSLGVERTASEDDIRKAFRKLARQYHPDVAKDKKSAEEKFKEINEAYEVLGDPEKRKKYDTLGMNWNRQQPPPGWQGGQAAGSHRGRPPEGYEFNFEGSTGFSDFFEHLFGGRAHQTGFRGFSSEPHQGGAWHERGADIEGDILVTLHEALHGAVKTISLQRTSPTGQVENHTFRVKIPAGVAEGKLIRIPGKGEPGSGEGEHGDLYLRVRFAKHPDFRAQGADLFHELDIAPWEAVLGATVKIPTIEGELISVKVAAGATNGQQLRVRGRGLPQGGNTRGDLYITLKVQTPSTVSEEERALWQQLADKSAFNPRRN